MRCRTDGSSNPQTPLLPSAHRSVATLCCTTHMQGQPNVKGARGTNRQRGAAQNTRADGDTGRRGCVWVGAVESAVESADVSIARYFRQGRLRHVARQGCSPLVLRSGGSDTGWCLLSAHAPMEAYRRPCSRPSTGYQHVRQWCDTRMAQYSSCLINDERCTMCASSRCFTVNARGTRSCR